MQIADEVGRRTSAALEGLELLRGSEVTGRAGGSDTRVGGVLEVHVGADTCEVSAIKSNG